MKLVQPRLVAHRGSVEAAGFAFDLELAGEAEVQRRVFACWQPGATLHALDGQRWILQLQRTMRVHAETCNGTALVRDAAGNLSGAPLAADERAALELRGGDVVLVRAGVAQRYSLAACQQLDPSEWLDVDDFQVLDVAPLASSARAQPASALSAPERDVRTLLGATAPEPAPEREALLRELHGEADRRHGSKHASRMRPRWHERLRLGWRSLLAALRSGNARRAAIDPASARPSGGLQTRPPWARMFDWLNARFVQLLYWTRIARVLGARQARYLQEMLEMFDRGDIQDALRHAIPLNDERTAAALRTAFARPTPRADLTISPRAAASTSTLSLGSDLFALVRQKYERAARTLEAQKRIEEAAFVWAELLGDAEAAVALLERNGQLRKAAQLAEGRELAPGLVVRQWFLAGDQSRAIAIAKRYRAFADAIARLEKSNRLTRAAERLRLLYGDALAEAGDYAGAVDVLWPLDTARKLAASFLLRALEAGGAQAGRSLARMLAVQLEPTQALLERVRQLASDATPHAAMTRLAFAHALLAQQPATPLLRSGARAALRALLGDAARGWLVLERRTRERLLDLAEDGALRADLPMLSDRGGRMALALRSTPIAQRIAASDVGSIAIEDAALLPDGRALLALGELGMRSYRADLRSFVALSEPAHSLVVNLDSTRVIALAPRGRRYKLARVETTTGRAQSWCDAEIDRFASTFDGMRWFIGAADALLAVDVTADDFRTLWRVERISGRERDGLADIAAGADRLELLVEGGSHDDYWSYELDTLKLRTRSPVPLARYTRLPFLRRLRPGTAQVVCLSAEAEGTELAVALHTPTAVLGLTTLQGFLDQAELRVRGDWAAAALWGPAGGEVFLVHLVENKIVLRCVLERSRRLQLRLEEHSLLVCDDLGRLRAWSLADGRVLCDLRAAV
jgi:hypothetical protein